MRAISGGYRWRGLRAGLATLVVAAGVLPVTLLPTAPAMAQGGTGTVCDYVSGCSEPEPAVERPADACGEECIPGIHPTVTISGIVRNGDGVALPGVLAYWQYGKVLTGSDGRYSIVVWGDLPVALIADDVSRVPGENKYKASAPLHIDNPLLAIAQSNDFALGYLLSTEISPVIFNDRTTVLTSTTYSAAPRGTEVALVHRDDGSTLAMDYVSTSSAGVSRYEKTWALPPGAADAIYRPRSCIVDQAVPGATCDTADALLSEADDADFTFDSTPPVIGPRTPLPNHDTTLRRPAIVASLSDGLSGLGVSSLAMTLDGTRVGATFSPSDASLNYVPSADLALDTVHTVEVSAGDVAGNSRTITWSFNVSALDVVAGATSLAAPVAPITFAPGTDRVRFESVVVRSSDSMIALSSVMRAGTGSAQIRLPLDQIRVRFTQVGDLSPADRFPRAAITLSDPIAAVAASTLPLTFPLRGRDTQVGPIEVVVPDLHRVTGGTARLELTGAPVPLTVTVASQDPLPDPISCTSTKCEIVGTAACSLDALAPDACLGTWPEVFLNVGNVNVQTFVVGVYGAQLNGSGRTVTRPPVLACGEGVSCGSISPHQPADGFRTYWVGAYDSDSNSALFGAYGHHFAYAVDKASSSTARRVLWQQGDVHAGSAPCVQGGGDLVRVRVIDFANTSQPVRGLVRTGYESSVGDESTQLPNRELHVKMRRDSGGSLEYSVANDAFLHEVTDGNRVLLGQFETDLDVIYPPSAPGGQTAAVGAVVNRWTPTPGISNPDPQRNPAEVMTAVEYDRTPLLAGGDALQPGILFRFGYEGSCA